MNWVNFLSLGMNRLLGLSLFLCIQSYAGLAKAPEGPHYYCTAVDEAYFPRVINLIGSIHKNDFNNLGEIAVFDLGMNQEQLALLNTIQKVTICQVEKKNEDILTPFKTHPLGWMKRGWFSWKPVVMKQALDMFPYVFYVDAGTTILKPLTDLFSHIRQNGYFLLDTGHNIEERVTQPVIEKVLNVMNPTDKARILDEKTMELDGGCQGLSSAVYNNYVLPVYNYASDLSLFMDDGSARLGFGEGRHDQILFSIYASKLGYSLFQQGWIPLTIDGKEVLIHAHWNGKEINDSTCLFRSRAEVNISHYEKFIHYVE